MDRVHGIGHVYDEGMESRSVMVPANGMVHKLREELKSDGGLLLGLIFLAYWTLEGSTSPYYFLCSLLYVLHFLSCIGYVVLKTSSATSNYVNL